MEMGKCSKQDPSVSELRVIRAHATVYCFYFSERLTFYATKGDFTPA